MNAARTREQDYFDRAFELAYCIHVNREIAFFIAEDALDGLPLMLDQQERYRKPPELLRGFLKWGERTRPVRKNVRLNELQMLQWLVYKHSESWERETESGEGLYLPSDEDLIVRYIKHLVFITLRRGSFYVTLGLGPLLHQFDRRETRLFYDILTQSDSARMKDTSYIGKQRLEMLERVAQRFGDMIETVRRPGEETQFAMRPPSPWVTDLVHESLTRFVPWESTCVIEAGFDVTDIPGLYFSETSAHDEELIEMNRIRAVVDPACFARLTDGLSKYVRTLPDGDQDKVCRYDSLAARLVVPRFSKYPGGPPRGDRFQPPKLAEEDYIRLQRTLDARANRRKNFSPRHLCVYQDGVLTGTFDPKTVARFGCSVETGVNVVEIRGRDSEGELTLITILLSDLESTQWEFTNSVVQPDGHRLTVRFQLITDSDERSTSARLEVSYSESRRLAGQIWSALTGGEGATGFGRWVKAGFAIGLLVLVALVIWWVLASRTARQEMTPQEQAGPSPIETREHRAPIVEVTPTPRASETPALKGATPFLARAAWSTDRRLALIAIPLEPTRGEARAIELSSAKTNLVLSLPIFNDKGGKYTSYRVTLTADVQQIWQQTVLAPRSGITGYAHLLEVVLFPKRLPESPAYDLRVEGLVGDRWETVGHVTLSPKE